MEMRPLEESGVRFILSPAHSLFPLWKSPWHPGTHFPERRGEEEARDHVGGFMSGSRSTAFLGRARAGGRPRPEAGAARGPQPRGSGQGGPGGRAPHQSSWEPLNKAGVFLQDVFG